MTVPIRAFRPEDGPALAAIVQRCLREVNSRDYTGAVIDKMCAHFTDERFVELGTSLGAFQDVCGAVADDLGQQTTRVCSRRGGGVP